MNRGRYLVLLASACAMEAGFIALAALGNFEQQVVEFTGVYLGTSIFYLIGCFAITCLDARQSGPRLVTFIWICGLVFRFTVLPLSPELSEDLNRYRWHGKMQAAGGNPYSAAPDDPRLAELRDATWHQVNRKDLPSVYGPVTEWVFAVWYRAVAAVQPDALRQVWWFKVPFALLELGVALALMRLLAAAGKPCAWLLVYLWSPLAVVEFWAQGHNDTLAVAFVVTAVAAALSDRWKWAFASLAIAALSKFWPVILFPFFLLRREDGRWILRWKQALAALPLIALVVAPYWDGLQNVPELLEGFLGGWRNNDSLYGVISRRAAGNVGLGAGTVTLSLAAALALLWFLQRPLIESVKWAVVVLLFFSANCFPWYLSWFLPFLAVSPNAALLLWTVLVSLAYHVLIGYEAAGVWEYSDEFRLLEYLPVYGLLLASAVARLALKARRERNPGAVEKTWRGSPQTGKQDDESSRQLDSNVNLGSEEKN